MNVYRHIFVKASFKASIAMWSSKVIEHSFLQWSKNHWTDFCYFPANSYGGATETGNRNSVHTTRSNSRDDHILPERRPAEGKEYFNNFSYLTHWLQMHPFSTTWRHQKTECFQGVEKGCIGNELVKQLK